MTIAGVTPESLRRELRALGYQEYESSGRAGVTWVNPADLDAPAVVVPRERDHALRGFTDTIASAVERISWITGHPMGFVVEVLLRTQDRLELRIVHELTESNSIPALKAPSIVKGFVDLIKNGARTAFNGARADHRGVAGPDYVVALANIRLLAPAPGSFRLVAVAVEPEQLRAADVGSASKARDALATTVHTLSALGAESRPASSLADDDVERLVDAGVSRQLLNAVKELTISKTSGLRLEFSGSLPNPAAAVDIEAPAVVIADPQVSLAKGLYERLVAYEPQPNFPLSGWAETARAQDRSLEGFPAGMIVVRSRFRGRTRDVLVELSREVFPLVKPGVSEVQMSGTLERISGRWHLLEPHDIRVSTPDPLSAPERAPTLEDDPADTSE